MNAHDTSYGRRVATTRKETVNRTFDCCVCDVLYAKSNGDSMVVENVLIPAPPMNRKKLVVEAPEIDGYKPIDFYNITPKRYSFTMNRSDFVKAAKKEEVIT